MERQIRRWFPMIACIALLGSLLWATSFGTLPPADFTFSNSTEIKTVDPSIVTGHPEGRIVRAIFEGLCRVDPKTVEPLPGVAKSWEISDDKRTYTFHLREDARWTDGSPVTAHDFEWSFRRFLHPETAAEYAYQLWYVQGAENYTKSKIKIGDTVEVELYDRKNPDQMFPSGTEIKGKLAAVEPSKVDDDGFIVRDSEQVFTVEVDGVQRKFSKTAQKDTEKCWNLIRSYSDTVGIKALEDRVLEITLRNPTPFFLKLVSFYPLFPVNRKCIEKYGYPMWTKPENIVSNGPYRLKFRRIRDRIRLVKSDTYWNRENVNFNTIDALAVQSSTTGLNMYLTGNVDWLPSPPPETIPLLKDRPDFRAGANLAIYFYRINVTREPLNSPLVRRALNMAIDKEAIVRDILKAGQKPARSFVPPLFEEYIPPLCGDYDVVGAKRLLAEAGYPDGKDMPPVEILYNTLEAHRQIAEFLQDQWKKNLGIDVRLKNQEWGTFLSSCRQKEYSIARAGWFADYPDPNTFLDMFVSDGGNNQTGWSNEEYDQLIFGAAEEPDTAKRLGMLRRAEEILMEEQPVIPLYFYVLVNLVRPDITGFYVNREDTHPLDVLGREPSE